MNKPMLFSKKPRKVLAMRLVGSATDTMAVCEWVRDNGYPWLIGDATMPETLIPEGGDQTSDIGIYLDPANGNLVIRTFFGDMRATYGDWVIQGVLNEFYVLNASMFEAYYQLEEN